LIRVIIVIEESKLHMLQNNNPTTITNRTKEPVINSRYELTELNLESVAKLPKLI